MRRAAAAARHADASQASTCAAPTLDPRLDAARRPRPRVLPRRSASRTRARTAPSGRRATRSAPRASSTRSAARRTRAGPARRGTAPAAFCTGNVERLREQRRQPVPPERVPRRHVQGVRVERRVRRGRGRPLAAATALDSAVAACVSVAGGAMRLRLSSPALALAGRCSRACGGGESALRRRRPERLPDAASLIPSRPAPQPTRHARPRAPAPEDRRRGRRFRAEAARGRRRERATARAAASPSPRRSRRLRVSVHSWNGERMTLDSTPLVGPDVAYCRRIGYTDGRSFCPVRPEGSPERAACEAARVGSARTPAGRADVVGRRPGVRRRGPRRPRA